MRILVIDDDRQNRHLYRDALCSADFEVEEAADGATACELIMQSEPDLVISDVRMPGMSGVDILQKVRTHHPNLPFLLITAYATVRQAVEALKYGAIDYLEKPVDLDTLINAAREALGLQQTSHIMGIPKSAMRGVLTRNPLTLQTFRDAYIVATSDAPVLITGESGTGKNVLARFIQQNSKRVAEPFITINCAAIPANLLSSDLFGHRKGAFTGAQENRNGKIREAEGGTLFLDEIGDMPMELQPTLLRTLETGRITPVGSDREIMVNFRLIAATNHALMDEILSGKFRQDLYYRLNVISFELLPLRKRPEDILPLAQHFLKRGPGPAKRLSAAVGQLLQAYAWPGNIRELANAMERADIIAGTDTILPDHLPPSIRIATDGRPLTRPTSKSEPCTLQQSEQTSIEQALAQTGGNRTRAAELLGISRRTLLYKLHKYNLGRTTRSTPKVSQEVRHG